MNTQPFSPRIQSLLDDQDLNRLVMVLRSPRDADLRAQAARALGLLHDTDATESLIRSATEDPDLAVQASARHALEELLGNQANLAIASYRSGPLEKDPWLVESPEGEAGEVESDLDTEGLIRVASHESNPAIRLQAIRALGQSPDARATDMLVFLALHGDSLALRKTARQALEDRYGDQAEEILNAASTQDDEEDDFDEDFDDELDEELSGDEWEEDDSEEEEDEEEDDPPSSTPSDYPVVSSTRGSGVVEEVGLSWQVILLVVLIVAVIAILAWLLFFRA